MMDKILENLPMIVTAIATIGIVRAYMVKILTLRGPLNFPTSKALIGTTNEQPHLSKKRDKIFLEHY